MPKTLTVSAKCYSDDHVVERKFDATRWLKQASDEEILELVQCEWGGDYPADIVAEHMANHDFGVDEMFTYIRIRQDAGISEGFECHVTADDAKAWIKKNRPYLAAFVKMVEENPACYDWKQFKPQVTAAKSRRPIG